MCHANWVESLKQIESAAVLNDGLVTNIPTNRSRWLISVWCFLSSPEKHFNCYFLPHLLVSSLVLDSIFTPHRPQLILIYVPLHYWLIVILFSIEAIKLLSTRFHSLLLFKAPRSSSILNPREKLPFIDYKRPTDPWDKFRSHDFPSMRLGNEERKNIKKSDRRKKFDWIKTIFVNRRDSSSN